MKLFVENLPQTCACCDFCHTKEYDSRYELDVEEFCGILNEDVEVYYYHGDGRPEFCPLKEIPKKMDESYLASQKDGIKQSYKHGWNNCINEMIR